MDESSESYVPPLRFRALTRFYDITLAATLKEDHFRGLLCDQADVRPGQRVLDVGCGTGSLARRVARTHPDASVAGVDADVEALGLAGLKASQQHQRLELHQSMSWNLPFGDDTFDRVVACLFFHHLVPDAKRRTLREIRRVLRPGGELHVADWGRAQDSWMRLAFFAVQLLDGFEPTSDHVVGLFPRFLEEAGLLDVDETHHERTIFGTMALYRATEPA